MEALLVLPLVLALVVLVVALVLLIRGTRGGGPLLAAILGTALLVLSLVDGLLYQWFLSLPVGASDDELFNTLATRIVIDGVLIGAGLILFTYAIVAADRFPKARQRGSDRRSGAI